MLRSSSSFFFFFFWSSRNNSVTVREKTKTVSEREKREVKRNPRWWGKKRRKWLDRSTFLVFIFFIYLSRSLARSMVRCSDLQNGTASNSLFIFINAREKKAQDSAQKFWINSSARAFLSSFHFPQSSVNFYLKCIQEKRINVERAGALPRRGPFAAMRFTTFSQSPPPFISLFFGFFPFAFFIIWGTHIHTKNLNS